MDLLYLSILAALVSLGFHYMLDEGMIFHSYYKAIRKLPKWMFKPLGGCITCNSTWIGFIIAIVLIPNINGIVYTHIIIVGVASSAIATMISLLINFINSKF